VETASLGVDAVAEVLEVAEVVGCFADKFFLRGALPNCAKELWLPKVIARMMRTTCNSFMLFTYLAQSILSPPRPSFKEEKISKTSGKPPLHSEPTGFRHHPSLLKLHCMACHVNVGGLGAKLPQSNTF
jgi:hypothetical protein